MWFTSLNGIHDKSINNFSTACIGGVFLSIQKRVKNLRTTITEPLEHMFGTTHSWKREFTVNEFIIFSNKLELIMTSVINHDIKTATSSKGYMTGFTGFAEVVNKIKNKLKKEKFVHEESTVAVDVNYNRPLSHQIEKGLIEVINKTQPPILKLMKIFKIDEVSEYCNELSSILDICRIYRNSNKGVLSHNLPIHDKMEMKPVEEEEVMQRLANLAMECNNTDVGTFDVGDDVTSNDVMIGGVIYDRDSPDHLILNFDVTMFYRFLGCEITNDNVGRMLKCMYESMGTNFEKKKNWGSSNNLQKVKSLNQRWFQATDETIEKLPRKNVLGRDYIFERNGTYYRILSIYKKSYGKWRYEYHADENEPVMAHVQELNYSFFVYNPLPKFYCFKLTNDRNYVGTHITS